MREIWKDIPEYEGLYQINNFGKIKSFHNKHRIKGKILMPYLNKNNRFYILLTKNKLHKMHVIHRLVAQAFIPNPKNKPEVNHIDGNPKNNNVKNLEWNTNSENKKHAYKLRLMNREGERHHLHKLTNKDILKIRFLFNVKKMKQYEIAKLFNTDRSNISLIVNNKTWSMN